MRTALIYGDLVVYRCAFAAEHSVHVITWSGGKETFRYKADLKKYIEDNNIEEYEIDTSLEVEPLENALSSVKSTISDIFTEVKPDDYKIFLSGKGNYRDKVATIAKYKGNRDKAKRPHWYKDVRKYLINYYDTEVAEGCEADDLLARNQTEDTVLCSLDKDLLQIPGKHFNWVKDVKRMVTPEVGLRTLWEQVLTGDKTDNIPGIYKVGIVTARKLLADCVAEEDMRAVCTQRWSEYLFGDKPPEWMDVEASDQPTVVYKHWDTGETIEATADDIIDELLALLKVK